MLEVDTVVNKLDPKLKKLVNKLRTVAKSAIPQAKEVVKWGNPTYVVGGKNVAFICSYTHHVDLGFFMGAKLKSKLLEGTGKNLRHIKVRNENDINKKEISRLLKESTKVI